MMPEYRKLLLIGSIFLMASLVVSSYVRIKFDYYFTIIAIPTGTKLIVYVGFFIFFLIYALLLIRKSQGNEKKVYYTWLIFFLISSVTLFSGKYALIGNLFGMIIVSFSIYYSYQFLKESRNSEK